MMLGDAVDADEPVTAMLAGRGDLFLLPALILTPPAAAVEFESVLSALVGREEPL